MRFTTLLYILFAVWLTPHEPRDAPPTDAPGTETAPAAHAGAQGGPAVFDRVEPKSPSVAHDRLQ